MSIRWKFLIILLVFSLTPLLLVTAVSQKVTINLGETISNLAKRTRTEIVSKELQQTARDHAKILGREKEILELTLRIIARDAKRVLSEKPKATPRVYFADDYDNSRRAPGDLSRSPQHLREASGGGTEPMPVSMGHQVFWLPSNLDRRVVAKDIARLAQLLPLHQEFERRYGDILYWQYVSLNSGVHAAFPGHGGYSPDYTPQRRPWFILAKERKELAWSTPYIDATSHQVIMTASIPVHHPDGTFAGVAAIDVLVSKILQVHELSSQWSPAMRSFLVWSGINSKTGESGLWVLAQKDYVEHAAAWTGVTQLERLASSDAQKMSRLSSGIETRTSGYLDMPYYGVDSIWAYAHAVEDVSLVLIVPHKIILEQVKQIREAVLSLAKRHWLITGITATAVILFLILAAFWFSRAMIRPMFVMVEAVRKLAVGDFSARMHIATGDERDLVADTFNEMVPKLEDRMHIRKALEVAQEVQQNLLPEEIPKVPGFDISAKSVYCDETGGDYFDFFPSGDEDSARTGVLVGDVTGHGIGAALLMATARALIRGLASKQQNLAECVSQVNRLLTADVRQSGNFMTLFFLELEVGSRLVRWVRAGHDPAILYDPATESFEELKGSGLVLGVDEDYSYQQIEKTIETAGTIILVGTDGIWEAHNGDGEMFGKARLYEIIRINARKTAEEIQDAVLEALSDFRGDVAQEDDVTIVVIKVL
ncbi:MAG: SpoIIE family protein phosphatase [Syntrophobacterales bacterium]|jgi:sigma-B regulation protein RsbU (phosphoserine phosphatase)